MFPRLLVYTAAGLADSAPIPDPSRIREHRRRPAGGTASTAVVPFRECPVAFLCLVVRPIGIGGNLAAPALPHHRTYGSRIRRFGGLSGGSVLTQARQAQRGEVALRQRDGQRGALTQTP